MSTLTVEGRVPETHHAGDEQPTVKVVSCKLIATRLREVIKRKMGHLGGQEETARRAKIITARQLTRLMNGVEHCPSLERAVALSVVLGEPLFSLFELQIKTAPARKTKTRRAA